VTADNLQKPQMENADVVVAIKLYGLWFRGLQKDVTAE
jgi:hypothetical protein